MAKYLGLSSAKEVSGKRVRLLRDAQNGYGKIPAGTVGVIETGYNIRDGRLHFMADKCDCCNIQMRIGGMSYNDFELID